MSPSIPVRVLRTQSDARLVELARAGHERAFESLVHRYRRPLLSYCRRLLLSEARAEEALQQALLQAWLALRDGCEVRNARAWLYRVTHNAAVSALRRSGYDYVELDESLHGAGAPESDLDRRIAVREALAGLAALPEQQRDVLLRTAVHGHSHEQVAAALGLSEGAVRGMVYRARATLRAAATALTPPQLVLWAARAAESGSGHAQLAEVAGGAGSAGLLGVLLKGGAVVVSAGVLAAGASLVGRGHGSATTARADPGAGRAVALVGAEELGRRLRFDGVTPSAILRDSGRPGRRSDSGTPQVARRGASVPASSPGPSAPQPFAGGGAGGQGASGGAAGTGSGASPGGSGSGSSGDSHEADSGSGGGGQSSSASGSSDGEPGGNATPEADEAQPSPAPPPPPAESDPAKPNPGGEGEAGGTESSGSSGDKSSAEPEAESEPGS